MPLTARSVRLGLLAPSLLLFAQLPCILIDPGSAGSAASSDSPASAGSAGAFRGTIVLQAPRAASESVAPLDAITSRYQCAESFKTRRCVS